MTELNSQNRKFLIFSLQESLYALDLAQVAEVADPPQTWPIPLAPAYYSGALSFHGDIVAVMKLSLFLGLSGYSQPGKVVVLRQEVASLAFLVDAVVRIISEDEVAFSAAPDNYFSSVILTFSGGKAVQLDLEKLVSRSEVDMQGSR